MEYKPESRNEKFPMYLTVLGISNKFNNLQPEKAFAPITVNKLEPEKNSTEFKDWHPEKENFPIDRIVDGNETDISKVQNANEKTEIDETEFGKSILGNDTQY
jgi:hypothetical protein